jgi:glycogen debranching enzyme
VLHQDLVLKHNELYLVGESESEGTGERASGLYARDTRFLDCWELRLNGELLEPLDARVLGADRAIVVAGNQSLSPTTAGREPVRPLSISVEQFVQLGTDLQVRIVLANHSGRSLPLALSLDVGGDFRDIFEIRGFPRTRRDGMYETPTWLGDRLSLGYVDRSGAITSLLVDFSRTPSHTLITASPDTTAFVAKSLLPGFDEVLQVQKQAETGPLQPAPRDRVVFDVDLERGASWDLLITLTPVPPDGPPLAATDAEETLIPASRASPISTGAPGLDRIVERAAADLAMLHTSFPDGRLTAAGIPWFVAPFGRDSLIAGLQTLHVAPGRAVETLRTLAALQGTRVDPFREEEPGKILHEMRYGEMARLGEIPHTPYYGSIDSTPLFVMLFAEVVRWTADEGLYRELLPHVERALHWIEAYGDRDGDGLIEYATQPPGGAHIIHQGWKDSHDSLHHLDGRPASGNIALVEAQGYVYAAYRWLADVTSLFGESGWAAALGERAERTRQRVEEHFWLPEAQYYAQALDAEKRPVAAISSNAGHLLFCDLPSAERASAVAERLRRPELDSGWGVRTLAVGMPSYNPMSYHNGSVWPHDNSLIAAGLGRYGEHAGLERIAAALFAAAERLPMQRLPELYCGFSRNESAAADAPVQYPVGCRPQAWAAGAVPLLIRSLLGLQADPQRNVVRVAPALPDWLPRVRIESIQALGARFDLEVERDGSDYRISSDGPVEMALHAPTA